MIHIGYILYSPNSSNSNSFCNVNEDGNANTDGASYTYGVAP